ncbi:beta-glucosidase family protein [Streptomyces griseorubiginosus]|uniref:beta-glucosidase family protein n=1 Tax=Streptomyces griseorubiginosus TaxID=67304 RepID=UPI000A66EE40|nr:glycoside hydrolase family 3 protein [Streptomyces griseorubiginosus]
MAAIMEDLEFDELVSIVCHNFTPFLERGVPTPSYTDGPCGLRDVEGGTALPVGIALAATFDPAEAYDYGRVLAAEVKHADRNCLLGPSLDIARDPSGGRLPEGFGEAPELVACIGEAYVHGVQDNGVLVMVKHFVANNFETRRTGWGPLSERSDSVDVRLEKAALWETYLWPFHRVAQAGAGAFMGSYNRLNGRYTCESGDLLDIPRIRWNWPGFFMPDYIFAVRDVESAWRAGLDLPGLGGDFGRTAEMVRRSGIDPAASVRRIAQAMIASGAADSVRATSSGCASTTSHRGLARRVATRGAVLLKNAGGSLPLDGTVGSIAVVGPSGLDALYVMGGSASVPLEEDRVVTPLAGLQARAAERVRVAVAQGSLGDAPLPDVPAEVLTTPDRGSAGVELVVSYEDEQGVERERREILPTMSLVGAPEGVTGPWTARLRTMLTAEEGGEYRLSLLVAGHAELAVNGTIIMAGAREAIRFLGGPLLPLQAVVDLPAGQATLLELTYELGPAVEPAEVDPAPGVRLGWQHIAALHEEAAAVAAGCDAAIVIVNAASGEGMDRTGLGLPGDQDVLVERIAAVNPRTIVVLNTPGAVLMPWIDKVGAVLEMWYPGEQFGHALADIVFGDVAPGGRLPVTFPVATSDLPGRSDTGSSPEAVAYDEGTLVGYRNLAAADKPALFPFGHGLSYGVHESELIGAHVEGTSVRLRLRVSETSGRPADATIQVYVRPEAWDTEPRRLVAFRRVPLAPHERAEVTVVVESHAWLSYDDGADDLVPRDGTFELTVADDAEDPGIAISMHRADGALSVLHH